MKTLDATMESVQGIIKGGAGSGNFGHAGRPGEIGGSGEGGGGSSIDQKPIKPLQDGRKWVEHVDGMPTDTLSVYIDNRTGKLRPERQALHDEIRTKFMGNVPVVPENEKPIAIVMMDGPASGKSSMVRNLDQKDFVRVDTDAIREHLPEYQQAVKAGAKDAALITHEEASLLGQQIKNQALAERKNIIFDGTGKNAAKYEAMIKDMKANGYEVTLMMPVITKEEGQKRVNVRAAKTGRDVPSYVMDEGYQNRLSNFERISKVADNALMFDNMGESSRPVYERYAGKEPVTHDAEFIQRFREADAKKA